MKLFMVPLAPNPTKVMLYIAEREELGVEMNIEQIVVNTVKGRHKEPEHLARNPFGTVPTLELDDGSYLVESLAIIDYLERRFPDNALLPTAPEAYGFARDVERIIDLRLAGPMGAYGHAVNSPLGYPKDDEKSGADGEGDAGPAGLSGRPPVGPAPPVARRSGIRRGLHAAGVAAVHAVHRSGCLRGAPPDSSLG